MSAPRPALAVEPSEPASPAAGEPAIRVRGVRKRFRKYTVRGQYTTFKTSLLGRIFGRRAPSSRTFLQALDGIDLDVPRGSAVGIIGRNGSGKSTLLKLVAGILRPDQGTVEVHGRLSPLIELGAGFHPEFSGRENVYLNGIVLGLSRAEIDERFATIVDFAELRDCIDDPVRTYSSGMYMRLGFSIAVHASPDILLIDEILAVGDEAFSKKCAEWVAQFLSQGKTILLVTHDLSAVERWCDEVVWLNGGRVRLRGSAREVTRAYREAVEAESGGGHLPAAEKARRVALIDAARIGATAAPARNRFRFGESVDVEIEYRVVAPLAGLSIGFEIRRTDGVRCLGVSTRGVFELPRAGRLRCRFPSLPLLDGNYVVDVTVEGSDGAVDHWEGCAPFSFESNRPGGTVFEPAHEWAVDGS